MCVNTRDSNIESVAVNVFNDLDNPLSNKALNIGIAIDDKTWHTVFCLKYLLKVKNPEMKIFHLSRNSYYPALVERDKCTHFYFKKDEYDYLIVLGDKGVINSDFQGKKIDELKIFLAEDIGNVDKYSLINEYKV